MDGTGTTSSINIGAYGGHNEMERVRIPLKDYLAAGSGLDLSEIAAVRLDVGPEWGSSRGRIVIDELMLTDSVETGGISAVAGLPGSRVRLVGFPNPFNPRTTLEVELVAASAPVPVNLTIIDLKGHRVATLYSGSLAGGGTYRFVWNGTDDAGRALPSGTYFAHVRAGGVTANHKLVLVR